MMFAVERKCCTSVAAVLLEAGADPCASVTGSVTALHTAARLGWPKSCELLLARADLQLEAKDTYGRTALTYAASYGQLDNVQMLLQHGADVNIADDMSKRPLDYACALLHINVATCLLEAGADVNAADCDGNSVLMLAAQINSAAVVQLLLDHGADISITNKSCQNALYKAAREGHVSIMELLLQRGCSITAVSSTGITALMIAAGRGHIAAAEWLLQRDAAVDAVTHDGCTVLHCASMGSTDNAAMIELLLANGADVHKRTEHDRTALDVAASEGNVKCAKALIAAGIDVNDTSTTGHTSLHIAVVSEHSAVVQLLLDHGATAVMDTLVPSKCPYIDQCCTTMTALMVCTDVATTKALLAAGVDVAVANDTGDTCLHLAVEHELPVPVICLLLKAGADLRAVNNAGKTAAQLAHERGYALIEQLLKRAAQQRH
jgi:uncharacterized protein